MPPEDENQILKAFADILSDGSDQKQNEQIAELQRDLEHERDARMEERFAFIVALVLLLDVVFFTVMPSFGGPLALLILELLILIPLAKRMGMQEIAKMLSRVLDRMAGTTNRDE